jgi:hypothetical protein
MIGLIRKTLKENSERGLFLYTQGFTRTPTLVLEEVKI